MAINVIVSSTDGPSVVTAVPDGGALKIAPGMMVRVEVQDPDGSAPFFVDPADLEASTSGGDATVDLPDGQTIVLLGYGETLLEQALGEGLAEGLSSGVPGSDSQAFGAQISIDYHGDGLEASRVNLYFDKHEGLDVDALFVALETELGLRPATESGAPAITGMNVVEQPLDLSDLLLASAGTVMVNEPGFGTALVEAPVFADVAGLWGAEEESLAVNDNDFMINA